MIPGLIDTHIHAPQYVFTGTGTDLPLLEWLNRYTLPVEAKYKDLEFADRAYRDVVVGIVISFHRSTFKLYNFQGMA